MIAGLQEIYAGQILKLELGNRAAAYVWEKKWGVINPSAVWKRDR